MNELTLADGTVIDIATGKPKVLTRVEKEPETSEASDTFEPLASEIKLEDLPGTPQQMAVVCAALGFSLIGLPTHDVSLALGCTLEQLEAVTSSEAYDRTRKMILEAFVRGQTSTAREIISTGAIQSARQIVEIATKSKSETNRLKAAETVLKAAGVANEDAHSAMAQGLVIKVIRDQAPTNISIKVS